MPNPFLYKKQVSTDLLSADLATWVDQSDNSMDGSAKAVGEPLFSFGDADSEYWAHFQFDGVDDVITRADNALFSTSFTNDESFSIAIRVIPQDITSGNQGIFSYRNDANNFFTARFNSDGQLQLRVKVATGTESRKGTVSKTLFTVGTPVWLFFVVSAGVDLPVVYVGDTAESLETENVSLSAPVDAGWFLARNRASAANWHGLIDVSSLYFFNRALSQTEVTAINNGGDLPGAIPTIDQWGNQTLLNVSNCENAGGANAYDTLERIGGGGAPNSATEFHAVKTTSGNDTFAGTADEIIFLGLSKYNVSFDLGLNSGTAPLYSIANTLTSGNSSEEAEQRAIAGSNFFTFTKAVSAVTGVVYFTSPPGEVCDFEITNLKVVRAGAVMAWRLDHENAFSPFEFPKGRQLPVNFPIVPRQIVGVAGGGQTVVDDLGNADERFPINVLRVSATVRTNLLGFLQDSTVNYRKNSFFFVEEDASEHEVRLWEPFPLDFPRVPGSLFNISIVVRKEVS